MKKQISLLTVLVFSMTMMIPARSFASSKSLTLMDKYGINKEGSLDSWDYEVIDLGNSSREIYITNGEEELSVTIQHTDDKLIQISTSSGKSKTVNSENPLAVITAVNEITPTGTQACIIWWVVALSLVPWQVGIMMIMLSAAVC